jgi:hypothetical protein
MFGVVILKLLAVSAEAVDWPCESEQRKNKHVLTVSNARK